MVWLMSSFMYRRIQTRNVSLNGSKRRSCVGWLFLHRSSYDHRACLYCKVDDRSAVTICLSYSRVLSVTATYGYALTRGSVEHNFVLLR